MGGNDEILALLKGEDKNIDEAVRLAVSEINKDRYFRESFFRKVYENIDRDKWNDFISNLEEYYINSLQVKHNDYDQKVIYLIEFFQAQSDKIQQLLLNEPHRDNDKLKELSAQFLFTREKLGNDRRLYAFQRNKDLLLCHNDLDDFDTVSRNINLVISYFKNHYRTINLEAWYAYISNYFYSVPFNNQEFSEHFDFIAKDGIEDSLDKKLKVLRSANEQVKKLYNNFRLEDLRELQSDIASLLNNIKQQIKNKEGSEKYLHILNKINVIEVASKEIIELKFDINDLEYKPKDLETGHRGVLPAEENSFRNLITTIRELFNLCKEEELFKNEFFLFLNLLDLISTEALVLSKLIARTVNIFNSIKYFEVATNDILHQKNNNSLRSNKSSRCIDDDDFVAPAMGDGMSIPLSPIEIQLIEEKKKNKQLIEELEREKKASDEKIEEYKKRLKSKLTDKIKQLQSEKLEVEKKAKQEAEKSQIQEEAIKRGLEVKLSQEKERIERLEEQNKKLISEIEIKEQEVKDAANNSSNVFIPIIDAGIVEKSKLEEKLRAERQIRFNEIDQTEPAVRENIIGEELDSFHLITSFANDLRKNLSEKQKTELAMQKSLHEKDHEQHREIDIILSISEIIKDLESLKRDTDMICSDFIHEKERIKRNYLLANQLLESHIPEIKRLINLFSDDVKKANSLGEFEELAREFFIKYDRTRNELSTVITLFNNISGDFGLLKRFVVEARNNKAAADFRLQKIEPSTTDYSYAQKLFDDIQNLSVGIETKEKELFNSGGIDNCCVLFDGNMHEFNNHVNSIYDDTRAKLVVDINEQLARGRNALFYRESRYRKDLTDLQDNFREQLSDLMKLEHFRIINESKFAANLTQEKEYKEDEEYEEYEETNSEVTDKSRNLKKSSDELSQKLEFGLQIAKRQMNDKKVIESLNGSTFVCANSKSVPSKLNIDTVKVLYKNQLTDTLEYFLTTIMNSYYDDHGFKTVNYTGTLDMQCLLYVYSQLFNENLDLGHKIKSNFSKLKFDDNGQLKGIEANKLVAKYIQQLKVKFKAGNEKELAQNITEVYLKASDWKDKSEVVKGILRNIVPKDKQNYMVSDKSLYETIYCHQEGYPQKLNDKISKATQELLGFNAPADKKSRARI